MLSAKCGPFCSALNMLKSLNINKNYLTIHSDQEFPKDGPHTVGSLHAGAEVTRGFVNVIHFRVVSEQRLGRVALVGKE